MKIALVRPPTITFENSISKTSVPPVGLAYIGAALKMAHFEVYGIDAPGEAINQYTLGTEADGMLLHGLTHEQIVNRISPGTQVIGVTVMFTSEWLEARKLLRLIKQRYPEAHLTVGGEHITALPEFCLMDCPEIDSCVIGEGEETMVELCQKLRAGAPLSGVKGLIFREAGRIQSNPRRPRIADVDSIAEPAWDLFDVEVYSEHGFTHGVNLGRSMPIMASRGCPYQCTFCSNSSMWTPLLKARSPECVVAEMKKYISEYKATNFDFYDLTAIVKKDWILNFCRLLEEEKLQITWQLPSGTRSEVIDAEVAAALYRAGCRVINYAPESGSPKELKRIKKKVDIEKMLSSMKASLRCGLKIKVNIIFGIPGADWSDVLTTLRFIAKLALIGVHDIGCFSFSPYPGSQIFEELKQQKKITVNDDYFRQVLTFNDPLACVSFSDVFTSTQIRNINYFGTFLFYFISFAVRPMRLARLIWSLLKNERSGKLAMALSNRTRKKEAIKQLKQEVSGF
jgi:radical SAM superfamily enzyme YgiQ (UPF0313 family)